MGSIQQAMNSFITDNKTVWSPRTSSTCTSALRRFASYLESPEHISLAFPTLLLAKELNIPERYAEQSYTRLREVHEQAMEPSTPSGAS